MARNQATKPVERTAQRRRECSQSADEYMKWILSALTPNSQLPTSKECFGGHSPWKLEVGRWTLQVISPAERGSGRGHQASTCRAPGAALSSRRDNRATPFSRHRHSETPPSATLTRSW